MYHGHYSGEWGGGGGGGGWGGGGRGGGGDRYYLKSHVYDLVGYVFLMPLPAVHGLPRD